MHSHTISIKGYTTYTYILYAQKYSFSVMSQTGCFCIQMQTTCQLAYTACREIHAVYG
jgi:hypothetical protein